MARVLRKLQDDPQMAKECTDLEAILRDERCGTVRMEIEIERSCVNFTDINAWYRTYICIIFS